MKPKKQKRNHNGNSLRDKVQIRKLILLLIDIFLCFLIGLIFLHLRDQNVYSLGNRILALAVMMASIFLTRWVFRIYSQVWRYASAHEYLSIVGADVIGCAFYLGVSRLLLEENLQIMIWQALSIITVNCLVTLSSRFAYQCYHNAIKDCHDNDTMTHGRFRRLRYAVRTCLFPNALYSARTNLPESSPVGDGDSVNCTANEGNAPSGNLSGETALYNKINVAIIGAGSVGVLLARELLLNKGAHYRPYCFVDTDSQKVGNTITGIRVYPEKGIIERLKALPIQEVIIALPNLDGDEKQRLYEFYHQSGCKVKLYDFSFSKEESGSGKRVLREFSIEDLLSRDVIRFETETIRPAYQGKTILVTGGGGSIGSELCRQLAKLKPGRLVVFDIYENNAYDIEQELIRQYGKELNLSVEIGSVQDEERLRDLFETYRPQIVFHAAAHKHVPLMEHSCSEAIKNNVFGTLNTVKMAEEFGVERFLLVSTDKAVNPTNVMGASKRLCEMIIQSKKKSRTNFVAVRFGNVLGSNGSVIPLFKKQIASGGPITLTDKRIIRYFMTIPEAAQLLLQTCAMASPGEIYVLDMGRPVKILELAENMVRLSGLTPYVDIDIQEIGLRPGEKLYEELLMKTGDLGKTDNEMIFIERDDPLTEKQLEGKLEILRQCLTCRSQQAVVDAMRQTVPTYHCPEEVNEKAEQAEEMRKCVPSYAHAIPVIVKIP